IGDVANMAYLLKHDTVHGRDDQDIRADGTTIVVDGRRFPVLSVTDPRQLPWRDLAVEVVVESTGGVTTREQAEPHLDAGARRTGVADARRRRTLCLPAPEPREPPARRSRSFTAYSMAWPSASRRSTCPCRI